MSTIKAGDLVVVTKPHPVCGCDGNTGKIFTVQSIGDDLNICYCGKSHITKCARIGIRHKSGNPTGFPLSMLTRIDPLPESETQDNQDEATA